MAHIIKLLCTSDIHGIVSPVDYGSGEEKDFGLARMKTLIDPLRDDDTIVIDNGDTIQGSPLTLFHEKTKKGSLSPVTKAMAAIGYDYIVPGNHDFNYGEKALLEHIDGSKAVFLCANMTYKGKLLGPEYVIRDICGRKLALFGITSHLVPLWERPENIKDFSFTDALECAKAIVKKIKAKEDPDWIICVYHGGVEKDPLTLEDIGPQTGENQGYAIMKQIGEIDALLCGHQHSVVRGEIDGRPYLQPGEGGQYLSCIRIDADTGKMETELIKNDLPADRQIMDLIREEEDELKEWLDTPLGHTSMDLRLKDECADRLNRTQLFTFINKVQLEAGGADLSAASLSKGSPGFTGEITMRDLMATYRFPNTLVVKQIDGKSLREYLETCARFWKVQDDKIIIDPSYEIPSNTYHNYDVIDGVEYTIKASNAPGQRIVSLTRKGIPVKDDDLFTIALNSYRASGSGGFELLKGCPTVTEIQRDISEMIMEYIMNEKEVSFTPVNDTSVII